MATKTLKTLRRMSKAKAKARAVRVGKKPVGQRNHITAPGLTATRLLHDPLIWRDMFGPTVESALMPVHRKDAENTFLDRMFSRNISGFMMPTKFGNAKPSLWISPRRAMTEQQRTRN